MDYSESGILDRVNQQPEKSTRKEIFTDPWWLISFFVGVIFVVAIACFSFYYGNPRRLINGFDSFGNICGVDNQKNPDLPLSGMNMTDRPHQFFLDTEKLTHTISICVKECPQRDLSNSSELYSYYEERLDNFCQYDFNVSLLLDPEGSEGNLFDRTGPCPTLPVYQSAPVFHRCMPSGKNAASQQAKKMFAPINSWEGAQQVISDLMYSWPTIVLSLCLAFFFSIGLIALLHNFGTIVSYVLCFCGVAVTVGFAFDLWRKYLITQNTLNIFLVIVALFGAICMLVAIYCWRKELPEMRELYKNTGNCILQRPKLLLLVIALLLLQIFVLMWYFAIFIHLGTSTFPGEKPPLALTQLEGEFTFGTSFKTFKLVEHHGANTMRYVFSFINTIGLISTVLFIAHFQQLAIAGVVAPWFFFEPSLSVFQITKYYLGTVAKGSFIITFCKIPRIIFLFFFIETEENGSIWSRGCAIFCRCGLELVEKHIHRLNHNAYVITAMQRHDFHLAAKTAWESHGKYWDRIFLVCGASGFVLFLGKLVIAALSGLISMLLLHGNPALYNYMVPVIIISVFAFFIADIILSAFDMVADTLLVCYCTKNVFNPGRCEKYNLDKVLHIPAMYRRSDTRGTEDGAGDAKGASDTHLVATISGTIPPAEVAESKV